MQLFNFQLHHLPQKVDAALSLSEINNVKEKQYYAIEEIAKQSYVFTHFDVFLLSRL